MDKRARREEIADKYMKSGPDAGQAYMGKRSVASVQGPGFEQGTGSEETASWSGGGGFNYKMADPGTIVVTHPDGRQVEVVRGGKNGEYFDVIMAERAQTTRGGVVPPPDGTKADRRSASAEKALSRQELEDLKPPENLVSAANTSLLDGMDTSPTPWRTAGPPQEIKPIRWSAYGMDYEINPQSGRIKATPPSPGDSYELGPFDDGDEYKNAVNAYYQQDGANASDMAKILGFGPE